MENSSPFLRLRSHITKTKLHLAMHCPTLFSMFTQLHVIIIWQIYSFYKSAKLLLNCQLKLFPLNLKHPYV